MSKIDDFNEEMKELSKKLDHAMEAVTNGTLEKSEAKKISRDTNKRLSKIANEYAKSIKNKNSEEF